MNDYMIDVSLPEFPGESFFELIPAQRDLVDRLISERAISSYAVSADRMKLWVIVRAESESKAIEIIESFPIYEYLRFDVYELMFHRHAFKKTPYLSLN